MIRNGTEMQQRSEKLIQVKNIVDRTMRARGNLSLRDFAREVNVPLVDADVVVGITSLNLWGWRQMQFVPAPTKLSMLKAVAPKESWQYQFAKELLDVIDSVNST